MIGLGLLCLPLLLEFGPYIEESRGESRAAQAYMEVRRIQERLDRAPADGPMLDELDPWGHPYQARQIDDGVIRVLSSGSNGQSPAEEFDDDDIYTGMPVSPAAKTGRQKRVQWLIALAEVSGIFSLAVIVYLSLRRIPE